MSTLQFHPSESSRPTTGEGIGATGLPDPGQVANRDQVRVGLALGASAYLGAAHLGVIVALERAGIPIDLVAGTSGGALAGLMYCAGIPTSDTLTALEKLGIEGVYTPTAGPDGFTDMLPLRERIEELIGLNRRLETLSRAFACVATDAIKGEPVVMTRGQAASAVLASMALPGLVRPVDHAGLLLVDGAVVLPIPVSVAFGMGADVVIAVDLNLPRYGKHAARSPKESFGHCFDMAIRRLCESELKAATVVIRPGVEGIKPNLRSTAILFGAGLSAGLKAVHFIHHALESKRTSNDCRTAIWHSEKGRTP